MARKKKKKSNTKVIDSNKVAVPNQARKGKSTRLEGKGPKSQMGKPTRLEGKGPKSQMGKPTRLEGKGPASGMAKPKDYRSPSESQKKAKKTFAVYRSDSKPTRKRKTHEERQNTPLVPVGGTGNRTLNKVAASHARMAKPTRLEGKGPASGMAKGIEVNPRQSANVRFRQETRGMAPEQKQLYLDQKRYDMRVNARDQIDQNRIQARRLGQQTTLKGQLGRNTQADGTNLNNEFNSVQVGKRTYITRGGNIVDKYDTPNDSTELTTRSINGFDYTFQNGKIVNMQEAQERSGDLAPDVAFNSARQEYEVTQPDGSTIYKKGDELNWEEMRSAGIDRESDTRISSGDQSYRKLTANEIKTRAKRRQDEANINRALARGDISEEQAKEANEINKQKAMIESGIPLEVFQEEEEPSKQAGIKAYRNEAGEILGYYTTDAEGNETPVTLQGFKGPSEEDEEEAPPTTYWELPWEEKQKMDKAYDKYTFNHGSLTEEQVKAAGPLKTKEEWAKDMLRTTAPDAPDENTLDGTLSEREQFDREMEPVTPGPRIDNLPPEQEAPPAPAEEAPAPTEEQAPRFDKETMARREEALKVMRPELEKMVKQYKKYQQLASGTGGERVSKRRAQREKRLKELETAINSAQLKLGFLREKEDKSLKDKVAIRLLETNIKALEERTRGPQKDLNRLNQQAARTEGKYLEKMLDLKEELNYYGIDVEGTQLRTEEERIRDKEEQLK